MTTEQMRLMAHLDDVGGWITLYELSGATPLADDDDLFVPNVVARGWADHDPVGAAVHITNEGCSALGGQRLPAAAAVGREVGGQRKQAGLAHSENLGSEDASHVCAFSQ